jgi:hypothetical protein
MAQKSAVTLRRKGSDETDTILASQFFANLRPGSAAQGEVSINGINYDLDSVEFTKTEVEEEKKKEEAASEETKQEETVSQETASEEEPKAETVSEENQQ